MNGWGAAALGLSCGGYMLAFARVFGGWLAPLTALCALGLFLYCGALAGLLEAAAAPRWQGAWPAWRSALPKSAPGGGRRGWGRCALPPAVCPFCGRRRGWS